MLKFIITILLIGLVASLASGLFFLFKDVGTTRRTLNSLGVRITLAIALMAVTVYGFYSGQLKMGAPWDARKFQTSPANDISTPNKQKAAPEKSDAARVEDATEISRSPSEVTLDDVNEKE